MIEKRIVVGLIQILENGVLQIREDTVIFEDGIELSRTYHRDALEPGSDVSNRSDRIKAIAAIIWTPEVVDARKRELDEIYKRVAPVGTDGDNRGIIREPGTS